MFRFRFWRRPARQLMVTDKQPPYYWQGGRRHLRDTPYVLPKDAGEIQRLDFQHFLLRYGLQSNYLAPIQNPLSILDVGCGTGRWAMELAQEFPQANVVGTDLVSTEHFTTGYGLERQPENYTFVPGNVLERLPFADNSFDFVHQRLLITAIPVERWPSVVQELVRVTRPGGWIELAECGVPQDAPGQPYPALWDTWIALCHTRGVDFTLGHRIGSFLEQAGLRRVQQHEVLFPMGAWGQRIGIMSATDCLATGKALRAGVLAAKVMAPEQYDALLAATEAEFKRPAGQSLLPFYIAYGQKRPQ